MAQPTPARTKAFISYSHKDKEYLEELQDQLKFLQHRGLVDVFWADTEIKPGDVWRAQIKEAIAAARVALFLISPAFFASEFITQSELPTLLEAAKAGETVILSVILDHSLFEFSDLVDYQTINDLGTPLAELTRAKRNAVWVQVAKRVMEVLQRPQPQPAPPPLPQKTKEQWVAEGNIYLDAGRYAEALECYDEALKLDSNHDLSLAFKGWALNELKRKEEALTNLDQALAQNGNLLFACVEKGVVLGALDQDAEGKRWFERAVELNPVSSYDWANKGYALYCLGRSDEALAAYDQALALNPKNAITWNNKGGTLYYLGRYDEALAAYDQALALHPKDVDVWMNKGNALNQLRRKDEAKAAYKKAHELGWRR